MKEPSAFDFRCWLEKKFIEGRIDNISKTQHWIDIFLRDIKQSSSKTSINSEEEGK